jgi:hypothetical protein
MIDYQEILRKLLAHLDEEFGKIWMNECVELIENTSRVTDADVAAIRTLRD